MRRKLLLLISVLMLLVPIQSFASQLETGTVISQGTKFKLETLSQKQTNQVQALAKQMQKPMQERKRKIVLNYSGSWDDVYEIFDQALLTVLLADEYLAYDYRGYSYTMLENNGKKTIEVDMMYYQTTNQVQYVQQKVKDIVRQQTNSSMTAHEKVKVLHDYVVDNVSYDYSMNQGVNAAYYAIKNGQTLCNGYAMMTYLLLKEAGIEARLISGSAGSGEAFEYHAWNLVKLDGQWFHLDTTWNDYDDGIIRYNYYLMSDATMRLDHDWYKGGLNGNEHNYPVARNDYFKWLQADEMKEPLQLFNMWRDPQQTATTEQQFNELLAAGFNKLQPEVTVYYYAEDELTNVEQKIEAALAASGVSAQYDYNVEVLNSIHEYVVKVTIMVAAYDTAIQSIYFDGTLQAPSSRVANVLMERSDGKIVNVSGDVQIVFDNETLAQLVGNKLKVYAPGTTKATFTLYGEQFEQMVVINGSSPLNDIATKPYPVEAFKVLQATTNVPKNKIWTVTTSNVMTAKNRPVVRIFDANGQEVFVKVSAKHKKIRITPPTEGYQSGQHYRLFIQFNQRPQQNSSFSFQVN